MAAGVLDQLRGRVEAHRLAVQQRGEEGRGREALEPGRGIHQQREAGGVGFGKAVAAEALDLLAQALGEVGVVAVVRQPVEQLLAVALELALAPPGTHRAAQLVGLAAGKVGRDHRELHHLLLEDRHAQRARQHTADLFAQAVQRILAARRTLARLQVGMDHAALDRAGAHDRDFHHQVVEALRPQARQHGHLRARLDLEHADRIGARQHFVDLLSFARDGRQRQRLAAPCRHQGEAATQRRQHAEREHVDLHQADRVEVVLVPLDHGAIGHGGVLHRHQLVEPAARDDEAADVLGEVARKADEFLGECDQPLRDRAGGVEPGLREALGQDVAAVEPVVLAGEALDLRLVEAERAADVAQRAACAVADHGGGERGAFAAVLAVEVLDDLLAALVLEVDVDVGRLVALSRDEALDQHDAQLRVDLGDAQRPAHHRVGRRAAALAQDAALAGEAHDVVHGEEVGLVAELGDERELVLDLRAHRGRGGVFGRWRCGRDRGRRGCAALLAGLAVAPGQPALDQPAQPARRGLVRGDELGGVLVAQLVEVEAAARRHRHGLGEQLGRMAAGEGRALVQAQLGIGRERQAGLGHAAVQAQRAHHVGERAPRGLVHERAAGGDRRDAGGLGDAQDPVQAGGIASVQARGVGDPGASGEALRQPARFAAQGDGRVAGGTRRREFLGWDQQRQAAGQGFGGSLVCAGGVEHRAREVVAALVGAPPGLGEQAREPAVAGAIGGEQDEAGPVGEAQLAADDQARPAGFGQGLQRAVGAHHAGEGAFVGEGDRAVAEGCRLRDELLGVRGAALEAEVAQAVEFGVGGKHVLTV